MKAVIGIDAGGSRIRALAVDGVAVVGRGTAGPGNPHVLSAEELAAHYSTALDGLPRARAVAVCAAGAGSPAGRARLRSAIEPLAGGARLAVLPDYAAVWAAAPAGTAIVAIAGTGSVIASRANGRWAVTGGSGRPGGDPGSAARLGRAALLRGAAGPPPAPTDLDRLRPAEVAAHAPRLTAAAERGERWAADALRRELAPLAADIRRHAARLGRRRGARRVAVAGGVFASAAALDALASALGPAFDVRPSTAEPVVGAVRIARELAA